MEEQLISSGGMQYVPQMTAAEQIIYLDFDGELTTYDGEILSLENVEVENSALTAERIACIVSGLNEKYASQGVLFVSERPAAAEYSTIFIGKTSAFDQYGSFVGLAETIDTDNLNKTDKAFVNLDKSASDTRIIDTISHETNHLLGTLNHGGKGLAAYAEDNEYHVNSGETSTGIELYYDSMYVSSGGTANYTTVKYKGELYVSSGGTGNDIMHDGGGDDIFYFGANWGEDIVEQLDDGSVTLWFETDNGTWNEETLTYTDGTNTVTVKGTTDVELRFGVADVEGAFLSAASENIFEKKGSGMLA